MSLPPVSMCLNAGAMGRQDAETETLIPTIGGGFDVAHTLRGDGFDASEDGTGRGTPLVPVMAFKSGQSEAAGGVFVTDDYAPTLQAQNNGSTAVPAVAYRVHGEHSTAMTGKGSARVADPVDTTRALDTCGGYATNQGGNVVLQPVVPVCHAVAPTLQARTKGGGGLGTDFDCDGGLISFSCKDHGADAGEISPTLRSIGHDGSHANAGGQVAVAFAQNQRDEVREMEVAGALAAEPGMKQQTYLAQSMAVRRLTPRECERLQGAEDDWTLVPNAKGKPMADGPRYKMLGNSFAVPVIRWIGRQIERAVAQSRMKAAA